MANIKKTSKWKKALKENLKSLFIALIIALFVRAFVVQAFKIPSGSMLETLQIGDFLLVNKFIYGIRMPFTNKIILPISNPKRGDIVVFQFPKDKSKDYIKRIVAIEGDRVKVINNELYINSQKIEENYIKVESIGDYVRDEVFPFSYKEYTKTNDFAEITIPKDSYFALGDNRNKSYDSRYWGFVHKKHLRGKALIIYWSWENISWEKKLQSIRWSRFGKLIN